MGTSSPNEFPRALARGRERFEDWRRTRKQRRIPEHLWALAATLAGTHGVQRTARALRLNAQSLRQRSALARPTANEASGSGFVELPSITLGSSTSWVVELTAASGARLRIEARGAQTLDVELLARELLCGSR